MENKTIFIDNKSIKRTWHIIDASNQTLGSLATKVAVILRGKHKVAYSMHQDMGDFVIVINSSKIQVSKDKDEKKMYYWHSGYIGGLGSASFKEMIKRKPDYPIRKAIKGMLPKNKLGTKFLKRLKIYPNAEHRHHAQQPVLMK